ncbi:MAG: DNA primase [Bacteroidales bacterium]|nr:DNA primase [Bacteroidales bacterium]
MIDRETVQRILDAADIVEVVSDFVTLKKRGANYMGLCPFHNERTPSFSVSKAKNYCKCFSCGKGGSPVGFIMEHEQMSYGEALRYLAKKYHIEIKEREMTDTEREEASERESMLAINDFAMKYYQDFMANTDEGRDVGLAYFRQRGINDLMIEKFRLGFSPEKSDAFYQAAVAKGYNPDLLVKTGLVIRTDEGRVYDRFRARVIYPCFSVSGRVVAFGGRTLRTDKKMAKYVNSPESSIYRKSYELYGLYQAKSAIAKRDKCILVEGYMDVISMHQVGVENVVASSGTSLTEGQIRLIHRFTNNVTVIYDSDAAGIKASLRGIDLLLAEGLDIKVLLLPDGDDPDSFAQAHSATEVEEYLKANEVDFITFKTRILLKDAGADPLARSKVITDIVRSIAMIPNPVTRAIYVRECSRMLDIDEKTLALQLDRDVAQLAEKRVTQQGGAYGSQGTQGSLTQNGGPVAQGSKTGPEGSTPGSQSAQGSLVLDATQQKLRRPEMVLAKYIVKYGFMPVAEELDENPEAKPKMVTVIDYIDQELANDEIELTHPVVKRIFDDARQLYAQDWPAAQAQEAQRIEERRQEALQKGHQEIALRAKDLADIQAREQVLNEQVEAQAQREMTDFTMKYLEDFFLSSPDDQVRILSTALATERYSLSKVHTKYQHVDTELDRLQELVVRAVMELKFTILDLQIAEMQEEIRTNSIDPAKTQELMSQLFNLYQIKSQFAKFLGERIVNPK